MSDTEVLHTLDLAAEKALVGACILSAEARSKVRGLLTHDAFCQADNGTIFRVVAEMEDAGQKIDAVTVLSELRQRDIAAEVGGVEYLAEILASVPDVANVGQYAETVLARHKERQALDVLDTAARRLRLGKTNGVVEDVLANTTAKLAALAAPAEHGRAAGPVVTCLADVVPQTIAWLCRDRIPLGRITLLAGRPGEGKSFVSIDWAARVTTGTPWPDGSPCPRGSVVLINYEDDPSDTTRPRLDAHCADVRRVHSFTTVRRPDENGKLHDVMFTVDDIPSLERVLQTVGDVKLIIIDPAGSAMGAGVDAHRDNEVRGVLAPLAMLAQKYNAAVLIVVHVRKAMGLTADDAVLGSRAFTGIARAVWHLTPDKDDRRRRLLLPGKMNLGPQPDGWAFTIGGEPPAIRWEREPVKLHADEVLLEAATPGPAPEAREAAQDWLKEVLANGPVASGDKDAPEAGSLRALAKEADLKWITVRRAADKLGVRRERCPFTKKFTWRLPKTHVAQREQHEKHEQHEQQEKTPKNKGQSLPREEGSHVALVL